MAIFRLSLVFALALLGFGTATSGAQEVAAPAPLRTVEELERKMRLILHKWHDSTRGDNNSGAAGNTLEDLLGVEENNFALPDFGTIELKTQKYEGKSSLLSLFHKEPKPAASVKKLLKAMGWRHTGAGKRYKETEMSFRSTTYADRWSVRGFRVVVTEKRIDFVYDPTKVEREGKDRTEKFATYGDWANDIENRTPHYRDIFPLGYDLEDVKETFQKKLGHTLLALRKTRKKDGKTQFWFEEAYLMKDVKTEMIAPLLQDGSMALEFDAQTSHNHGTKFRIKRNRAPLLFNEFRLVK
jgi:hypothetical protein